MLKRIAVSMVALCMLVTCYGVYVYVFGRISLEPLPEHLRPPTLSTDTPWANAAPSTNHAREMARRVWGRESWQAADDVVTLYWLQSGVIIYIKDYEKESADTWRLVPFALIYTDTAQARDGADPQIVTMQGQEATLLFDQPVDLIRMSGARPIGGKISGNVQIQADRGTPDPVDDLVAYTDELQFNESDRKVWTDSSVRMVSADAVITGTGGKMHLNFQAGEGSDTPRFKSVSDLILERDVQVNMLAGSGPKPQAKVPRSGRARPDGPPDAKMPVQITCRGPFRYDLESSEAQFDQNVMMARQTSETQYDRLFSDALRVLFEKMEPGSGGRPAGMQFNFREARATGRSVRVVSDSQSLEAIGKEMVYNTATGSTVLRGDPDVVATKDGNVLNGRELRFATTESGSQFAESIGAGNLEARDADGTVRLTARWTDGARIVPQGDHGKNQLLTLQGGAEVDQPGRGRFSADRLQVWLQPTDTPAAAPIDPTVPDTSRWSPSRVEGVGNVLAESDQFRLQAATRLDMIFEDPPQTAPNQQSSPIGSARGAGAGNRPNGVRSRVRETEPGEQPGQPDLASGPHRTKPPAQLTADVVKIRVIRVGERTELSLVETEGRVHFEQPGGEPDGQSVIVQGDTLTLKRVAADQHALRVAGRPARVQMNDMKVDGDRVSVDQPTGTAWVDGKGVMTLTSDTSFDGKKLESPSELTIAWGSRMFFDGLVAEFGGGVEARQGTSRLRCQSLVARLTEQMNLASPRDGESSAAKIKELECTNAVVLENIEWVDGRLARYEYLETPRLNFSNQTGEMTARGPGIFRTCTRGNPDMGPSQPAASAADGDQLFLTEVQFADALEGNRAQQIAKFTGHVQAIRSPVAEHTEKMHPDRLPPNGMRIACHTLEMASKQGQDDSTYSVMIASDNVSVESDVFIGRGDRVSYNQLHDRIIFESRSDTFATFYRQPRRGAKWDETKAFKIYYNLGTGAVKVDGAVMLELQERETDRRNSDKSAPKRR